MTATPLTRAMTKQSALPSIFYYFRTFILIGAAVALSFRFSHPAIWFLSIIFIGARQHSLYVLNHEASHGNLFVSESLNKWVATVFSNLVFFHHPEAYSYVQWRRVHRLHHAFL